ncbi:MAG: cardiolipin synthase B [Sphingobium sp.]
MAFSDDPAIDGDRFAAQPDLYDGKIADNDVYVIPSGTHLRETLIALIDCAQNSLKLYYYIFASDSSGHMVRDALINASIRGVEVTLMIDAFGSGDVDKRFFDPLIAAGGRMKIFGSGWSTRYLIRNHQKMTIADDARILIGGFNVADGYFGLPQGDCWHDLGMVVEGPAVAPMVRWYRILWLWVAGKRHSYRTMRKIIRRWNPAQGTFRWLIGGPTNRLSPWARMVRTDLAIANRVDMVAAYFSPGQGLLKRLRGVAARGTVRFLMASKSDNGATIAAARLLYGPLLRRGAEIYEYLPCKLHMKLIVIDDAVYIGSANFDMRSLFVNLEVMLRIEDANFARAMRAAIDVWAQDSLHITQAVQDSRKGPWRLLKGWISYFLVGVLDYTVTRRLNFRNNG